MNFINYKYVDFPLQKFNWESLPTYKHQLESHPTLLDEDLFKVRQLFSEDEQKVLIEQSYYFIHETYNKVDIHKQSDTKIPIEDYPFAEVHGNSKDIILEFLSTYQVGFSFLLGNNDYRPYTDKLFKHSHQPTFIDGIENRSTFAVIYPVSLVEEITESFKLFFVEEPSKNVIDMWKKPLTIPVPDDITDIAFPKSGQALILHFNSVNGIHWVEGLTNNNFVCHTLDSVTLRKELC